MNSFLNFCGMAAIGIGAQSLYQYGVCVRTVAAILAAAFFALAGLSYFLIVKKGGE